MSKKICTICNTPIERGNEQKTSKGYKCPNCFVIGGESLQDIKREIPGEW